MKTTVKFFLAASVLCAAILVFSMPVGHATAQDNPTATSPVVVATDASAGAAATDETVPKEIQALRAARAVLSKKLGVHITYVKAWTWELLLFHDSALGCPNPGQTPQNGDAAGYRITITTFDGKQYELHVTYDLSTVYTCAEVGGASTAGSSPLPAPAAVSGNANVGGFEIGGQIQDFNSGTVAKLQSAHMHWIKRQVAIGDGGAAGIIAAGHGQGFKVLLSITTGGNPGLISNGGFADQLAGYAAGVASSGADAIEILNEMNIDREWPHGAVDPAAYTAILAKSYNAIKGANANTIVISGALAPTGYWGGSAGKSDSGWDDDVYYAGMAAAGAGQYADCIGVHYNEGIVSPNQSSGDPRDNYPTRYFASMLARAIGPFGGKQACFTELGYLTPEGYPPLPGGFAWAQNTTVAQQAQWLAQAAVMAANSGQVRLMIVFNVDFTLYGTDPQAGYAMIRPGGSCPACDALAAVVN